MKSQYLREIKLDRKKIHSLDRYPFCLPAIKNITSLEFHPNITFFVGENGTGKSTILEAIAISVGLNPEGGSMNFNFSSRPSHSELFEYIRVIKGIHRPKDGFFLRSESFYNFATNVEELDREKGGTRIIDSYGGRSLHEQSHGESFWAVFMNRLRGEGLYILDEPEAALSPSRQMSMISRMHQLVKLGTQFVIATHSPIIMAYPNCTIYEITDSEIKNVKYSETQNYLIMKTFISKPEKMVDLLIED